MPDDTTRPLSEILEEMARLRARIVELEAEIAMVRGTYLLHRTYLHDDAPTYTHDVPPNAPR